MSPLDERHRMLTLLGSDEKRRKRLQHEIEQTVERERFAQPRKPWLRRAADWLLGLGSRTGVTRTTTVDGKVRTRAGPRLATRTIAQYNGLPVIYPNGSPCYELPEDAVLTCRGTMRVGDNELAAYVYEGSGNEVLERVSRRR